MAITDKARRDLFTAFEESLGTDNATTAMELLPVQPSDQLVTRTDMHAFGAELRGEMAELRGGIRSEMAELRAEMAELRADMNMRFATAKVETQRLIVAGMIANAIAVVTALVT